jgi:capsular polysaccharide biosynthesis protein
MSTAGRIAVQLKRFFLIEGVGLNVNMLVAFVQTFATGPMRQAAGMVIVEKSHQSPMQP